MGEIAELGRRWPRLLAEARDRGDLYAVMNLSTYLLCIVRLAADEPEHAREGSARPCPNGRGVAYRIQHNDQAWGTAQIELYAGRGGAGLGPDHLELAGAVAFAPTARPVHPGRHVAAPGALCLGGGRGFQ